MGDSGQDRDEDEEEDGDADGDVDGDEDDDEEGNQGAAPKGKGDVHPLLRAASPGGQMVVAGLARLDIRVTSASPP